MKIVKACQEYFSFFLQMCCSQSVLLNLRYQNVLGLHFIIKPNILLYIGLSSAILCCTLFVIVTFYDYDNHMIYYFYYSY